MTVDAVNMPPASAGRGITPHLDLGLGFTVLLGTDYERRKEKLQQELKLDYKDYVAKKKDLKTREPHPQLQGLSLPINENISVKEKLREERNKEYNLFLQEKAQIRNFKRQTLPGTSQPGQVQASDAIHIPSPASHLPILNTHANTHPPHRERPASRRDAATVTDALDNGKNTGTWEPGNWGRRRWQLYRPKEPYSSEEELVTDKEEELEFRQRRRKERHNQETGYNMERQIEDHRVNCSGPLDMKEMKAPSANEQDNNDRPWKSDLKMPDTMKRAARSRHNSTKDKAEFTGLLIGATEEQTASQLRKEQYMLELRKQIAEQQSNKMREKTLELRVAATGATDPEKKPDRLKQLGVVNHQHVSRIRDTPYKFGTDPLVIAKDPNPRSKDNKPTENTEKSEPQETVHVDSTILGQLGGNTMPGFGSRSAQVVPSLDEDYQKYFSNMLGEFAIPRVANVPPPIPPTIINNQTPYDSAYYYGGTRNPLDSHLHHYQSDQPGWVQQSGNAQSPLQKQSPLRPSCFTEASPLDSEDKTIRGRESAVSYQEALRQQIKERAEQRRREKEEKEQYDSKIEAEMKAYNPWGRCGGGAPIKDQNGNLFNDLNQRNKLNQESYRNFSDQTQNNFVRNGDTPGVQASAPLSHHLSGFNDHTTHQQKRYRETLEKQIQENKKKQEEERDRIRIEEEKEERRLMEQRARIQQEYEEEQSKQKKTKNQSWVTDSKTPGQNEENKKRLDQQAEKKGPQSSRDKEEKRVQSYEREPSPPIPTLQKKQTNVSSSPSSVVSQVSSRPERSVSAPQYRPDSLKLPQLQDDHQEVIRELSALRRFLRKEQKDLEVQLGQTDQQESYYTPSSRPGRRLRVDAFDSAHQADKPTATRIYSDAAHVSMKNIREFNQLKSRDSASREELLHMYPDPPTDAQSLDIQQQALLREQGRKIRLMKRQETQDFMNQQQQPYPRDQPGRFIHRDSVLPSETAFIDVYSGDACEEEIYQQRTAQPSAQRQERTAPRRAYGYDISINQRKRETQPDFLWSPNNLNDEVKVKTHNRRRIMGKDSHTLKHHSKSEISDCLKKRVMDKTLHSPDESADEGDVSFLHPALERPISVETHATESWLQPGTSAAVKY